MRRALRWLVRGALALGVIAGIPVGGPLIVASIATRNVDADSKAFVAATLPGIVARWDTDAMFAVAAPQFIAATPSAKLVAMFGGLRSRLGVVKQIDAPDGEGSVFVDVFHWSINVWADYVVRAEFEHGAVRLSARIIRTADGWRYVRLNVDPISGAPA